MNNCKQVEIHFEDYHPHQNPRKWCYPLKEDVFVSFMSRENGTPQIQKIFGAGSFFSPLLFGKFFDPSDAFPLWEFDSDSLLHGSAQQRIVDWFQTDEDYVLKAELPEPSNNSIQVCIENGKILEINVQSKKPHHHHQQQKEPKAKDYNPWKSRSNWWEHGYVRRIELSSTDQIDWRRTEAYVKNDVVLEIKIPKTSSSTSSTNRDVSP